MLKIRLATTLKNVSLTCLLLLLSWQYCMHCLWCIPKSNQSRCVEQTILGVVPRRIFCLSSGFRSLYSHVNAIILKIQILSGLSVGLQGGDSLKWTQVLNDYFMVRKLSSPFRIIFVEHPYPPSKEVPCWCWSKNFTNEFFSIRS